MPKRLEGDFNYIVVGAGTAGCIVANRLSADPAKRVLILEAGGRDNWIWFHIPVGYLFAIGNPRSDWMFKTEPEAGLNGRALAYPRGKVIGGSSAINAMIYMRGQARDYDQWAALTGDARWRWDAVLPYFRRHEDHWRLDRPETASEDFARLHGHRRLGSTGEWRVEKQRLRWDILDAFAQAAQQAGIPATDDFNRGDNEGCDYFEVNQRRGLRWNASKAFLKPARHRANLRIVTGAQVASLLFEGRRARGVRYRLADGTEHDARAGGEVVLAAGAIGSAQLLQVSGIGPGPMLQELGIPVLQDLPGVGGNLQDHLQLRMVFTVKHARTLNTLANSPWGKAWMGLQFAFARRGPLTMAPSQLGAFARSGPEQARANVEYHVQPLSLDKFGEPLHHFPAITASVCNLRPTSRGRVRVVAPDARNAPEILCNYLQTDEDCKVAAASIRLTRRIVSQPAMARYQPEEWRPGAALQSDAELIQAAREIGTTIFHPVGTCKMGADPLAVVDDHLRVRGVEGLRVIDASIMPTITSGNTNSPTLVIAEKGARLLLQAHKG